MRLTDEDIRAFQEIWQKEFKEEIAPALAHERAAQLLNLYMLLLRRRSPPDEDKPPQVEL